MQRRYKRAFRLTAVYLLFGLLWIALSDWFVAGLTDDPFTLTRLQSLKGWLFVVVTAALVWLLIMHAQTRQSQLTDKLGESEARFRAVFENVNDGILIYDPRADHIVGSNAKMRQLFECRPNQMEALSIDTLSAATPGDNARRARRHLRQARAGTPSLFEWHVHKPNGAKFWAEVSIRRAEIGTLGYVVMVVREITEQKFSRERLRLSAAVFENIRDGIAICSLEPRILAVNPAYSRITGYHPDEVTGRNPTFLRSTATADRDMDAMWQALDTASFWEGEILVKTCDDGERPLWLSAIKLTDDEGRPTHYVAVYTDISELKRTQRKLTDLAYYDPLTGLPNRILIHSRIETAIKHAQQNTARMALIYTDLDHFKNINDSFGHPMGDDLLVEVARRLREDLPDYATLAHLGADEFVLMLERLEQAEHAETLAHRLLERLHAPFLVGGTNTVYLTASAGISLFPEHGDMAADLMQYAHAAMYQAKKQGRQGLQVFSPAMVHRASERVRLEARLRESLEQEHFELHYQPLVAGADGRQLTGLECLARWHPPGEALIMPDVFIPIAEENGLIVPLGEWVLRTACRQGREWLRAQPDLTIAINLSVRQFRHRDMAETVGRILTETGFPAGQLQLELTESILMDQGEAAMETLNELKALGVRLALDDFGTGYSCLAYLRNMPLDVLKVDRQFIHDMDKNPQARELVAAIISMARCLNLEVLAEGIETAEQLDTVAAMGCRHFQGYFFSRPVPADRVSALLRPGSP